MARVIELDNTVTVGALAEALDLPVTRLIAELMKNGILATVNERIDLDTASIIVGELGLDVELHPKKAADPEEVVPKRDRVVSDTAEPRPPVVAVMGHVDHGKTSLLDAIRGENVAKGEAGGITQHISAYQIKHTDRFITLLDTPGHEAFAALREHGARLTDLVIIVVAADDGIKPQTLEAIRFARKAGVKMIIAINKIDKEGANVARIKQQLAEQNILIEEWGGDTVVVEVSAKTKQGIDKLLDMVFLVTDIDDLRADYKVPAEGLIIESHMENGRGAIAEALVEQGTIKKGDFVVAGNTYAKVRVLETTGSKAIDTATPSTPVIISGFKSLPQFGDQFNVVPNEKVARERAAHFAAGQSSSKSLDMSTSELMRLMNRKSDLTEFNIIVKADVQGSLTAVIDSLKTLDTDEVAIRVVGSGVGAISDTDIHMARTSQAVIYGFNIQLPASVKRIASRDQVPIRLFTVIYELLDDAKASLSELLSPEIVERELGVLEVKGVFKTTRNEIICGGLVASGKLTVPAQAQIIRGKEVIAEAKIVGLKRAQNEAKDIAEGEMCGMDLQTDGRVTLELGDRIRAYVREETARTL
jgi:translation initiation factor IF-2